MEKKNRYAVILIMLGILLLGVFLRIRSLASKPFWFDDLTSLAVAAKNLQFILTQYPVYKSAYIIILKIWTGVFGSGPVVTRILPSFCGVASILLTFLIGKNLSNVRTGIIASFLLSISAFHIYHSREVKHYTLLLFLGMLSVYFFVRFLSERKNKFLVMNLLLNIMILFVHPFGASLILVQVVYLILNRRFIEKAELKKWFLAHLPLFFAFVLWAAIIVVIRQYLQGVLWWVGRANIFSLAEIFNTFCYGFRYGLTDIAVHSYPSVVIVLLRIIFGLFFIKGLCVILANHRQSREQFIVIWLFLPVVLTFLFSYIFFSVLVVKHFLIILPAFYFFVAIGLGHKTKTPFIIGVLAVIFMLSFVPLRIMYQARAGTDWQKAVQLMKEHSLKDDDIIIMATTKETVCLMYYLSDMDKDVLRELGLFGKLTDSTWQESFQYKQHRVITLGSELLATKGSRYIQGERINADFDTKVLSGDVLNADKPLWLLISRWAGDEYYKGDLAAKLKTHFKMVFKRDACGIKVYHFEPQVD